MLANLRRGPTNNPAVWGGGYTFLNRVYGQPLFLVDPNSKFDPTTQLVLNPKAWIEPEYGTFGGLELGTDNYKVDPFASSVVVYNPADVIDHSKRRKLYIASVSNDSAPSERAGRVQASILRSPSNPAQRRFGNL